MSEMVERVARAIGCRVARGRTEEEGETDLGWDFWPDEYQENMRELARAAIAAMREPTEAMRQEGFNNCGSHNVDTDPAEVWRAMIDAALQPSPTGEEG